jgi:hypothetical protein
MTPEPLKSFFVQEGRCFRMIRDPVPERRGHAKHCPKPVVVRGRFQAESKTVYTVDAGAEHARELECSQLLAPTAATSSSTHRPTGIRYSLDGNRLRAMMVNSEVVHECGDFSANGT